MESEVLPVAAMRQAAVLRVLKVLSDPDRLALLRYLMAQDATLTHLAERFQSYPAKVRHHVKLLEDAGLVEMVASRPVRGFMEKYYRATAPAFVIDMVITPACNEDNSLLIFGSHDPALEMLASRLSRFDGAPEPFILPLGSLDGLIALRRGLCHMAGCHLLDDNGEYNGPFVRRLFPGQAMCLVTLAYRQQGLIVHPSHWLRIIRLQDLTRKDILFINRQKGSGTRLWLDRALHEAGIDPASINGFDNEVNTHGKVAYEVALGRANVGLGLYAAARKYDLGFIPLFEERYDLVIPAMIMDDVRVTRVLEHLQSREFRLALELMGGYHAIHTGQVLAV